MKKITEFWLGAIVIILLVFIWFFGGHKYHRSQIVGNPSANPGQPPSTFNKSLYLTDQSNSLWVMVNKGRILPSSYVPESLVVPNIPLRTSTSSEEMHVRFDMAGALQAMSSAAAKQGAYLMLASGYRSYSLQIAVYNGYVKSNGLAVADASSARPGHSEHQTGLAADLEPISRNCELDQCFENTPEGKWLAANSYKYGFIIRYPKGKEALTGYEYEPWHVRYVGVALAAQIQESSQTLEQFLGAPTYTDYGSSPLQLK